MIAALDSSPYGEPKLEDCCFYHTLDLPGIGAVEGDWDLRGREGGYLGNFQFAGKRVLEVGTASGALCWHMERQGADVVAYDLSEAQSWDHVPYRHVSEASYFGSKEVIRKMNAGWWLAHQANRSRAKVTYGSVYEMPLSLGSFDVATYCSILLHLRDPFLALSRGARLATETVIVVEPFGRLFLPRRAIARIRRLFKRLPIIGSPGICFLPNLARGGPEGTWWSFSPEVIGDMLALLGFADSTATFHDQLHKGQKVRMFTVVARRTHDVPLLNLL